MAVKDLQHHEAFNLKEFIQKAWQYKFFYLIAILICLLLAYTYNKIVPTTYQVSSIIGPLENRRSSLLESNDYFNGLNSNTPTNNLENDINSLKSFSLVAETIEKLGLEVNYYKQSLNFLNNPLLKNLSSPIPVYNNTTYEVFMDKSHYQTINTRFYFDIIDETRFRLRAQEDNASIYNYVDNKVISTQNLIKLDTICMFNQTIVSPNFKFTVNLKKDIHNKKRYTDSDHSVFFEFKHIDEIAKHYLNQLSMDPVSLRSTLINVKFQGQNLDLTVDFLNTFLQNYLNNNLTKKNNIAFNTVSFIDNQLSEISDSLGKSESKLRDYRAVHQVTDLSYQGQQALNQLTQVENEISSLKVQENYYNYILDYFNTEEDIAALAPPSAANVNDPIMNTMVLELLALNAEKLSILSNRAEKSLFLKQIENKIKLQKQTVIENVQNNLNALDLSLNELNYRHSKLTSEIARLPKTELNMVSMQRQFNITDAIYSFLLQKRSEAAISMASNTPDYEIIDPARKVTSIIVSPRITINYLLALFLGFFIPSLIVLLKEVFNYKITSVHDIERVIKRPILNLIYTNYHHTERVSIDLPNSSLAESFRNLRSNIFLKSNSSPQKTILVTSALPKDGKSFIAFNLAAAIAAVGHKTIIIDCDLRRPTLHTKFNNDNQLGLSNHMVDDLAMDKIILPSDINNLWYIQAGPILPNASELIEAGKLEPILKYAKSNFEYVILDTTPTGIVSDANALMKHALNILLVCRNNYTNKNIFFDILNQFKANKINNYDIVFNDLDVKKSNYKKYDSYYKSPIDKK